MIYRVLYQEDQIVNPRRETTKTLFLEAGDIVAVRTMIESNIPYDIEFIQELTGSSLTYEEQNPDFKLITSKPEDR